MTKKNAVWLFGSIAGVSFLALFLAAPFPQPQSYHNFVDQRPLLTIPNFSNVVTNVGFLMVGILTMGRVWRQRSIPAFLSWMVLAVSIFLLAFGSSYYHWYPSNASLVWDRLPMASGFMALWVALMSTRINNRFEAWLIPACGLGVLSVLYWAWVDDLRFYAWVQFFPFLSILLILFLFPASGQDDGYLWMTFGFYALAKLAEHFDGPIYSLLGGVVSGHSLKHLAAALGLWFLFKVPSRLREG